MIKDNQYIKKVLIENLSLLIDLLSIKEYGQTKLIIDLYTNDFYTQSHITPKLLRIFVKTLRKRMG